MSASGHLRRAAHGRKGRGIRLRRNFTRRFAPAYGTKKKARQSRALSAALRACVGGATFAGLIFVCDLENFLSYVDSLLHENVRSHKGACWHATRNFPGHEGRGVRLYVVPPRCVRNARIENEARISCTMQAQHWSSIPAPLNGGRCPKGENFAGGVSRSACLSEQSERVARRVVTGEIFRPE